MTRQSFVESHDQTDNHHLYIRNQKKEEPKLTERIKLVAFSFLFFLSAFIHFRFYDVKKHLSFN